jgi:uncharacterized membrane protein required for colicin V production
MNPLDLIAIVVLLLGMLAGARAGFLSPVLGLAGAVAGLGTALLLATLLRPNLVEIEQPNRALLTLVGLAGLVVAGEALGAGVGATMSHRLRHSLARPLDMAGGAIVGAGHVVLLLWLLGGMVAAGMSPGLGPVARESVAVRLVTEQLPPPSFVVGRLLALLDTTDLPQLFAGIEPPPAPPVDLPADQDARALAESALASTVRVTGSGCGLGLQVGSGFFVGPAHAVTNAHVVAGADATTITVGDANHAATVVLFDPESDLALLHAPDAAGVALQLAGADPPRGQAAVALGYPGGGSLTASPAAVTANYDIAGPNIYGDGQFPRSVVEMRSDIQRGNSGGPLVVGAGVVGGVVFGSSRTDPSVGYAIGATQAAAVIGPAIGATQAVDTGPCI